VCPGHLIRWAVVTGPMLARLERDLQGARQAAGADRARSRQRRRAQGAFFTPAPLVRFVVERTLAARWRAAPVAWRDDGSPVLGVVDPAAGDGRFLAAALEALVARGADRAATARRCLVGVERDPDFAALAREAVPGAAVHCGEALLDPPEGVSGADLIVGNPPYLRSIRFAETDRPLWEALRGRYAATSHGEWDLYAAFLEQALEWTGSAGQVGLVVPSRWLTAAFAAGLRAKLAAAGAVSAVVDFGAEQVFSDATTYASVAFLSRRPRRRVAVARRGDGGWECGTVEAASLGAAPWRLWVGERRGLLEDLRVRGVPLGKVARIAKGTGTNADPVFVMEPVGASGRTVRCRSRALDREVELEAAALVPCLRGRDIRAWGNAAGALRCLLPYDTDGTLWTPERLRAHPLAASYLAACRDLLEARERGRFRGDTFYRHGRPQNIPWLLEPAPKVVVPDVARDGRALLDGAGTLVMDSAYAIRLAPDAPFPLSLILAVMNSPLVRLWMRESGIPLRGGYLRLKTAYLATLPLPPPSSTADAVVTAVTGGAAREAIDDLVRRAYGVAPADW
jgi:hypothetical protein